jgi:hypothetical protein
MTVAYLAPQAETTTLTTQTGERIYDLCPLAGDLWAIAGPDGLDPRTVNTDDIPDGYRWLDEEEWSQATKKA